MPDIDVFRHPSRFAVGRKLQRGAEAIAAVLYFGRNEEADGLSALCSTVFLFRRPDQPGVVLWNEENR